MAKALSTLHRLRFGHPILSSFGQARRRAQAGTLSSAVRRMKLVFYARRMARDPPSLVRTIAATSILRHFSSACRYAAFSSALLMGVLAGYPVKDVRRSMLHGHPQMTIADLLGNPLRADLVSGIGRNWRRGACDGSRSPGR